MLAGFITDDDFVGVEAFLGASCFGNAPVGIMQAATGERATGIYSDNGQPGGPGVVSQAQYPELDQHINQGDITFFQIDLHQFRSETLPIFA